MDKDIYWLGTDEKEIEKMVLSEYSSDEIWKHLEQLTTLERRAGTEDELKAAQYIKGKLEEYGVDAEICEFDAYISYPEEASLEILSPVQKPFPCLSNVFIASTSPEGMEGGVTSVGKGKDRIKGIGQRG